MKWGPREAPPPRRRKRVEGFVDGRFVMVICMYIYMYI